jgi:uncharacterized protein (DUF2461 family)
VWPPAALEFLRELEANNDSAWFKANRKRYDESLVAPARSLAEKLSHLGQPHFFRPYNNLRFRPGPPIKEHLGVALMHPGAGAFYFELSLDGLLVGAGMHHPAPDQLDRFRAAMGDGRFRGSGRLDPRRARAQAPAARLPSRSSSPRPPAPEASHRLPPPPAGAVAAQARL